MAKDILIAPSILSADFARLGEEVRAIDEAENCGLISDINQAGPKYMGSAFLLNKQGHRQWLKT